MITHPLWVEKYRPHTIKDTILPFGLKKTFQAWVDKKDIPNLILEGKSGVGKTTAAKAMLDEIGAEYVVFNGSLDVDKDALRTEISEFASSMSLREGRKFVVLDEADYLSSQHVQPALRTFMEEFSETCGFILTCNNINRIIPALQSRCTTIGFNIPHAEVKEIAIQLLQRTENILSKEGVTFEKNALVALIKRHYPDFRRILNELQRYAAQGPIDSGILAIKPSLSGLLSLLKARQYLKIVEWVANSDLEPSELFSQLYDQACSFVSTPDMLPLFILILARYQYQAALVADQRINTTACLLEIVKDVGLR